MSERRLPRTEVHLERTRLAYVNLPNIISAAKADRSARITGLVGIEVGALAWWIFMREGDPVTAVRREIGKGARIVSIPDAVRSSAEETERGRIFYYGMPLDQLRAMFAVTGEPRRPPARGEAAAKLLRSLRDASDAVAAEVETNDALHYLVVRAGEIEDAFFADGVDGPAGETDPLERAARIADDAGADVVIRTFPPVAELPSQAEPALAALYRVLLERAVARMRREVGEVAAVRALRAGREAARQEHPGIEAFRVVGDQVEGEPVLDDADLTAGVAYWFLRTLQAGEAEGLDSAAEVAEEITREWRHALNEAGFLARLPWPLPI